MANSEAGSGQLEEKEEGKKKKVEQRNIRTKKQETTPQR